MLRKSFTHKWAINQNYGIKRHILVAAHEFNEFCYKNYHVCLSLHFHTAKV